MRKPKNVFRKENGRWVAHKRVHGRQIWRTFDTRAEAETFVAQLTVDVAAGTYRAPTRVKFSDFAEMWLDGCVRGHLRSRTVETYEAALRNHLLPHFGHVPVQAITKQQVAHFVADWLAAGPYYRRRVVDAQRQERQSALAERRPARPIRLGNAPGTVSNGLTPLQAMFTTAVEWGFVSVSPASRVRRPRVPHREMRVLSPAEVHKLLAAVDPRWRTFVLCAVTTGLRLGEQLGLRWSDLDADSARLWVRRSVTRGGEFEEPKTRSSVRAVGVTATLGVALKRHYLATAAKSPDALIFPSRAGGPLDGSNVTHRVFRPAVERAGIASLRWHDLRHTFASLLIAQGEHPKLIAEQMGHSSVRTTLDRYGHILPQSYADASSRLESVLFGAARIA